VGSRCGSDEILVFIIGTTAWSATNGEEWLAFEGGVNPVFSRFSIVSVFNSVVGELRGESCCLFMARG